MTHEEATQVLRVELPTTENALKAAFRRRASEEHPDHSKHPRAAERFMEVQAAFEALLGSPEVTHAASQRDQRCEDGTPLTECGLGLGLTVNGRPCPGCHGRGYGEVFSRERCPDCREAGVWGLNYEYRCRRCSGTGRFMRNGRDVGECFACKGTGWHRDRSVYNHCGTCGGTGYASTKKVICYAKCHACEGTGEIKVLNPVLPKGLFTGRVGGA